MYPQNTSLVIQAAYSATPLIDFICSVSKTGATIDAWNLAAAQPTEQQVNEWANDLVALPGGQLFSVWHAEWQAAHGGDATKTSERVVKEKLAAAKSERVKLMAILLFLQDKGVLSTDLDPATEIENYKANLATAAGVIETVESA